MRCLLSTSVPIVLAWNRAECGFGPPPTASVHTAHHDPLVAIRSPSGNTRLEGSRDSSRLGTNVPADDRRPSRTSVPAGVAYSSQVPVASWVLARIVPR